MSKVGKLNVYVFNISVINIIELFVGNYEPLLKILMGFLNSQKLKTSIHTIVVYLKVPNCYLIS